MTLKKKKRRSWWQKSKRSRARKKIEKEIGGSSRKWTCYKHFDRPKDTNRSYVLYDENYDRYYMRLYFKHESLIGVNLKGAKFDHSTTKHEYNARVFRGTADGHNGMGSLLSIFNDIKHTGGWRLIRTK